MQGPLSVRFESGEVRGSFARRCSSLERSKGLGNLEPCRGVSKSAANQGIEQKSGFQQWVLCPKGRFMTTTMPDAPPTETQAAVASPARLASEIGRASCRERV